MKEQTFHTLSFKHEIARTQGFVKVNGVKTLDIAGNPIPVVIRPDLPEAAKDRQYTINVINVPDTVISDLVLQNVVDKFIYGHGSYIGCTLWDHPNLQPGQAVQLDWNDIVEWSEDVSTGGGGSSEESKLRMKLYSAWTSGKLTPELRAQITPEIKEWMQARRQRALDKLTKSNEL